MPIGRPRSAALLLGLVLAAVHAGAQPRFEPGLVLPAGNRAHGLTAADLDGDGDADLIIGLVLGRIELRYNLGPGHPGQFGPAISLSSGIGTTNAIAFADVNLDGLPDILDAHSLGPFGYDIGVNVRLALPAPNRGQYAPPVAYNLDGAAGLLSLSTVCVVDVNADGLPDILCPSYGNGCVAVFLNRSGPAVGTFQPFYWVNAGHPYASGLAVGDFNGDGRPDLAITSDFPQSLSIATAIPGQPGRFNIPDRITGGYNAHDPLIDDFNGDGEPDLILPNSLTGGIVLWRGDPRRGNASFTLEATYPAGEGSYHLARADFDGDGLLDLAVTNSLGESFSILPRRPGRSAPYFLSAVTFPSPGSPLGIVAADFDIDGRPDLAVSHGDRANVAVYFNRTCAADFNRDGMLDFFDYLDFVTCYETAACPSGTTPDFNRDGFPDLFDYADYVAAFESGC